jgi:ribosome biogenesis GTPase
MPKALYSEDDFERFERAKTRRNRPRTKHSPHFEKTVKCLVVGVSRGRYTLMVSPDVFLQGVRSRTLSKTQIVCGDFVDIDSGKTSDGGTLFRIVNLHSRKSYLTRSVSDDNPHIRPFAANVDIAVILASVKDPNPNFAFIDRCLKAAEAANIEPIICITKTDLGSEEKVKTVYAERGIKSISVSVNTDIANPKEIRQPETDGKECRSGLHSSLEFHTGKDELLDAISKKTSVFIGQSGVGKSTLINILAPYANRKIGSVSYSTGKGRHTSSSSQLYFVFAKPGEIDYDTRIIDTPGVKSFGLGHLNS